MNNTGPQPGDIISRDIYSLESTDPKGTGMQLMACNLKDGINKFRIDTGEIIEIHGGEVFLLRKEYFIINDDLSYSLIDTKYF